MDKVQVDVCNFVWVQSMISDSLCITDCQDLFIFTIYKLQIEKAKQDDALSDLSNLLGELKNMAIDMGSEIERLVFYFCIAVQRSQQT